MKKIRIILSVLALMMGTVCHAQIIPPYGPGQIGFQAVVLCESLSLHQDPDYGSPSVKTLNYGDRIIVMDQSNGWAHCVLGDSEDSLSGWVNADYLAVDPAWYKTEENTAVYAWNDRTAPKVALLGANTTLPILKDDGDWMVVSLRGAAGWINHADIEEETGRQIQEGTFAYIHDPRDLPEAMADIIENDDAVYGFSPDPNSQRLGSYAEYDWTDPDLVEKAQEERRAYHESMESMMDILYRMREEGASIEEMARAVSEERNRLRLEAYKDDPEGLAVARESNLKTYGHEDGPTPDELYEKYGSWTTVLQKAFSPNLGMDVCCGLYDEYYWLYIELGYVEE